MMKLPDVLMLSIDQSLLTRGSDAFSRMKIYGKAANSLHIIVYSQRQFPDKNPVIEISSNVFLYPTNSKNKLSALFDMRRIAEHIFFAKKEPKPSWVITSQDPFTNIIGMFLRRKYKLPLEIQIHTDFLSPYFRRESLKNFLRFWLYRISLRQADSIRVVSQRILKSIKYLNPDIVIPIFVMPVFIDQAQIQLPDHIGSNIRKKYPQADFIILMASRLTQEKNIPLAFEAFSKIVKKYPKTFMVIVGDGPETPHLKAKISKLDLWGSVSFEPAVSFQRLVEYYYSGADLFLLTSYYEGYARTLIEATLLQLPVITSDVGIASEIFMHNVTGTVIPVDNREALEDTIEHVIQDYPRFQKYAQKSSTLIRQTLPDEKAYCEKLQYIWFSLSSHKS